MPGGTSTPSPMAIEGSTIDITGDAGFTAANGVVAGKGTSKEPYIIENLSISGPERKCISVSDTNSFFVIRNVTLSNATGAKEGIYLISCANFVIEDVTSQDLKWPIQLILCRDGVVRDCNVSSHQIEVRNCTHIAFSNITYSNGRIWLVFSEWISITGSRFDRYYYFGSGGVTVSSCDNVTVSECAFTGSAGSGICMGECDNVTISGCAVSGCAQPGIVCIVYNDNVQQNILISNCTLSDNGGPEPFWAGNLYIEGGARYRIIGNILTGATAANAWIEGARIDTIRGNRFVGRGLILRPSSLEGAIMDFADNSLDGVPMRYLANQTGVDLDVQASQTFVVNCTRCALTFDQARNGPEALTLLYCSETSVSDSVFEGPLGGVYTCGGDGNVISNSTVNGCEVGFELLRERGTRVMGTSFRSCAHAILMTACDGTTVYANAFSDNEEGVTSVPLLLEYVGTVAEVSDRLTVRRNSFSNGSRSFVYAERTSNCTVEGNSLEGGYSGIVVSDSSDVVVRDNNLTLMRNIGIGVTGEVITALIEGNDISECNLSVNLGTWEHGVTCLNVHVSDNRMRDGLSGVSAQGVDRLYITGNEIRFFQYQGIDLTECGFNIVSNTISGCGDCAIRFGGTGPIYLNNFVENGHGATYKPGGSQVVDLDALDHDMLDNGTAGNYWSDYQERYPSATNDGRVWSIPYATDSILGVSNPVDRFPLVLPFDGIPPVARVAGDLTIDVGTVATLDGSASSDDTSIVSYRWTFVYGGALQELQGATATFRFDALGSYQVTLTVADAYGNTGSATMVVYVIDTEPPTVDAGLDRAVAQGAPVDLFGGASSDNVGISEYIWWFDYLGENRTFRGCAAVLTVDVPGTYLVHLDAIDGSGNVGHAQFVLRVTDAEPPVARAGKDLVVFQNETVRLDGSASTDNVGVAHWSWTIIGPDTDLVLHGCNVSFNLSIPGMYVATLEVEDAERNQNASKLNIVVVELDDGDGGDGDGTGTPRSAPGALPYLIVGLAAAAIVLAIVLLARRRPQASVRETGVSPPQDDRP